jgi:hypothetical protein
MFALRNIRSANNRRSSIGSAACSSTTMSTAKQAMPPMPDASTGVAAQPSIGPRESARSTSARPAPENTNPGRSNPPARSSVCSRRYITQKMKPATPIGRLTKKIQRQST